MKKLYNLILILLIVIFAISSYFIFKEVWKNKQENDLFEDLQEIVQTPEKEANENQNTDILKNETSNLSTEKTANIGNSYNLENISKINADVIGWIKIDNTNINYPVMQNGDYYLHRNIYKNYSYRGTPYLADYCDVNKSDNLIIYGHHMKDNTMFSELDKYKKQSFYENHKYIKLYVLENGETKEEIYEIAIAFKTIVYSDNDFKYYCYTNFNNELEFNKYIQKCKELELYDTKSKLEYGDKLLTLSTCEYSQKNGRMVIIAKKI